MKDKIVVVGGYGQVGQVICRHLGELFPGKVYAAGRSLAKAGKFASTTDSRVLPLQMDVYDIQSAAISEDVALVVMCLDQENTFFVEKCLQQGIHYIDISASYSFLTKAWKLGDSAGTLQSTAVLSVGLAPGLTNLLVKRCTQVLDTVDSADIYLLLGLGDQHGKAAIEWMVDQIQVSFSVMEQGVRTIVKSFEDGKKTEFPGTLGRRMAYRFPFPDQQVLPQTLGIPSVSTRICLDSAATTRLIAWLKKTGMLRSLRHPFIRRHTVNLFEKLRLGSDMYVAQASAAGSVGGRKVQYACSVQGRQESLITGTVAALAARSVYTQAHSAGVYHMEELFQPMAFIQELKDLATFEEQWTDL